MPLAHLLAPMIMRKAEDIEAELGPITGYLKPPGPLSQAVSSGVEAGKARASAPPGMSYSHDVAPAQPAPQNIAGAPIGYSAVQETNIGYEKTPYDPRGVMNKGDAKTYDPRTVGGANVKMLGALQGSGDPRLQKTARAFLAGATGKTPQLIPNATMAPGAPAVIGYTEAGAPILGQAPSYNPTLKKSDLVGTNEKGEAVDRKGKKTGYLAGPNKLDTAAGPAFRTGERRKTDQVLSKDKGLESADRFGIDSLKQMYGKHLEAVRGNTDANGAPTDKFPAGYFKGMSEKEKESIKSGVRALMALEKGTPT